MDPETLALIIELLKRRGAQQPHPDPDVQAINEKHRPFGHIKDPDERQAAIAWHQNPARDAYGDTIRELMHKYPSEATQGMGLGRVIDSGKDDEISRLSAMLGMYGAPQDQQKNIGKHNARRETLGMPPVRGWPMDRPNPWMRYGFDSGERQVDQQAEPVSDIKVMTLLAELFGGGQETRPTTRPSETQQRLPWEPWGPNWSGWKGDNAVDQVPTSRPSSDVWGFVDPTSRLNRGAVAQPPGVPSWQGYPAKEVDEGDPSGDFKTLKALIELSKSMPREWKDVPQWEKDEWAREQQLAGERLRLEQELQRRKWLIMYGPPGRHFEYEKVKDELWPEMEYLDDPPGETVIRPDSTR